MHNDFMLAIWIPFFWDPKFEPQLSNQNRYRLIKNMYICKLENIYIIINYVNIHMYYNNYISVYMLLYTSVIFRLHVEAPTLPVQGSRMEYRSPQGFFHFGATKKTPEDSAGELESSKLMEDKPFPCWDGQFCSQRVGFLVNFLFSLNMMI